MVSPIYNEWVEEERREALEKGEMKAKIGFVKRLLKSGEPLEKIMEWTELPEDEIEKIKESNE